MLIMSPFCDLACEKTVKMPYSVLFFFLLTVLIYCRRQAKNNSMRLTDNCRCIYTDILILACCLEILLEVIQYESKFSLLERKNCQERQRMFLYNDQRDICGYLDNLPQLRKVSSHAPLFSLSHMHTHAHTCMCAHTSNHLKLMIWRPESVRMIRSLMPL